MGAIITPSLRLLSAVFADGASSQKLLTTAADRHHIMAVSAEEHPPQTVNPLIESSILSCTSNQTPGHGVFFLLEPPNPLPPNR